MMKNLFRMPANLGLSKRQSLIQILEQLHKVETSDKPDSFTLQKVRMHRTRIERMSDVEVDKLLARVRQICQLNNTEHAKTAPKVKR
jgi:hypothetical protein